MTHEDAGHYALKHKDQTVDPAIRSQLETVAEEGKVTCSAAHRIATSLGKTPAEVGVQVDLLEYRLTECCLGLFGHGPTRKKLDHGITVADELEDVLKKMAPEGRMTCLQCWETARKFKMKRMEISSACEKLGIKIKPCQLGAF